MPRLFVYVLFFFFVLAVPCQAQKGVCLLGNCQQGFGHCQWKTGEEYIGNFRNGKMHGYGIFYWNNKKKYIGDWVKGKIEGQGTLFGENGVIRKGLWKANKLIRMDRGKIGLTPENIQHGEEQLQRLLADRPLMKTIVDSNDLIWHWVVQQLAGAEVGARIYWQAKATTSFPIPTGVNAVHAYPTAATDGKVWLKNTQDAEQMWSSLIFELHNIRNAKGFEQIEEDAKNWQCTKAEYIRRYTALEYKAATATKKFYQTIWQPYSQSKGHATQAMYWFYYLPNTFEGWWATFDKKQGYPWHPYAAYYDKLVLDIVRKY